MQGFYGNLGKYSTQLTLISFTIFKRYNKIKVIYSYIYSNFLKLSGFLLIRTTRADLEFILEF